AAFPSAARTIVADAWSTLTEQAGGLELSLDVLEPEAALDALATGDADIAVVHTYSNVARRIGDELTIRPLVDEPVLLACRHDDPALSDPRHGGARVDDATVDLAWFARRPWVAAQPDLTCAAMVERACGLA